MTASIRMQGGEIEAAGYYKIKVRPFLIILPSSTVIEEKSVSTLSNSTVISSKKSIDIDYRPVSEADMLSKYPGYGSQFEVDQTRFQTYYQEQMCCEIGCEVSCDGTLELNFCDVSESGPDSDYTKKTTVFERWMTIYCMLDDAGTVAITSIYGTVAPEGSAEKPSVEKLPNTKSIIIGDIKLNQYKSIIHKDDVDYSRRDSESIEELNDIISPIGGTIADTIKSWVYNNRYVALRKRDESTGLETSGDEYIVFSENLTIPNKSNSIDSMSYPADKSGVPVGGTYTFNTAENKRGMLMYFKGFTDSDDRAMVVVATEPTNPFLSCITEEWAAFSLSQDCSAVCEIACQASCESSCQSCQVSCECGHEYTTDGRSYIVDPADPLNLDNCYSCDTTADLITESYTYTPCPSSDDVTISGICNVSCEGLPPCPSSYQNPCLAGCEVTCECSLENSGTTCFACDSGIEGVHTYINTPCVTNCEHGNDGSIICVVSTETQNCDCMCNTNAENSCQTPAQTSCGGCEISCEACDTCQTCQTGCEIGLEGPVCIPIDSCSINWNGVYVLGDDARFDASFFPSNSSIPATYVWEIVTGDGRIVGQSGKTCWIRWDGYSSITKIKVTVSNSCSSVNSTISIGETGVCNSATSVTISASKTSLCSPEVVRFVSNFQPNNITNIMHNWNGEGWVDGDPGDRDYTISNTQNITLRIKSELCGVEKSATSTVTLVTPLSNAAPGTISIGEIIGFGTVTYIVFANYDSSKFDLSWSSSDSSVPLVDTGDTVSITMYCKKIINVTATFTPKSNVCTTQPSYSDTIFVGDGPCTLS